LGIRHSFEPRILSGGALEAAGRGGGRHVERRQSTDSKVPTGMTESSPTRFQPWVASEKWAEPRRPSGRKKDRAGPVRSFVPDGTRSIFAPQPSDESLGYFRASLRDVDSRHADENRFQAEPTFGTRVGGRAAQVPSLSKHHSQIDSIDARKRMDGHCGDRFRLREPVRG
jgi:hypothetical protein